MSVYAVIKGEVGGIVAKVPIMAEYGFFRNTVIIYMNIRQKKLIRIILTAVLLLTVLIPIASNIKGTAAVWTSPINACYQVNISSGLEIKQSQNAASATVATVANGTYICVLNINNAGTWGYTSYNGKSGWVNLNNAIRRAGSPETIAELQKRFDAVIAFYPNGSTWKGSKHNRSDGAYVQNDGGIGPWECFGYASEVWRALYGTEMSHSYDSNRRYILSADADMKLKGTLVRPSMDAMKKLLLQAQCGDIIQGVKNSYASGANQGQHTMVVYSVASDGIYICDANNGHHGSGNNRVANKYFYTWHELYTERGSALSLYGSSDYPPEKALPIVGGNVEVKNRANVVSNEFFVQDKINFSADIKNARTITYYVVNKANGNVVHEYSSANTSCSYTFTGLDSGSTSYQVYYVAKNAAGTVTSARTDFTVRMPSVSISGGNITLELDKSASLKEKLSYNPTGSVKFAWTTADPLIAQVNSNGVVTAKKAGTTTVTVTISYTGTNGGVVRSTATISVTVFNPKYSVSFDVNGGEGSFSPITVEKTTKYGTLPTPTRVGYTFAGWFTAKSGGTQIKPDSTVSISADTMLYARWTANKYTVTLDGNGGTPAQPTYEATYDSPLTNIPLAVRPGYVFEGWFTAAQGGNKIDISASYKLTQGVTYYAQWSLGNFILTFDPLGGTATIENKTVTFTKIYGELPTAQRAGFEFGGWFTEKDGGGKQILAEGTVDIIANTVLYVKWIPNKYTVSFDSNTGEGDFEDRVVVFDSPYGSMPIPTKPGYAFVGWFTEKDGGKPADSTTRVFVPDNHTLYAHWEPGKFAVTFDPNGGQTPLAEKLVTYLTTYGELPVPTRVGYTFVGWFTQTEGGDKIENTTPVRIIAAQTLYAQWSVNTYSISFETNSESKFDSIKVVFDTAYGELPVPVKKGYTFVGWHTEEKDGTLLITAESILKIGEDSVLIAHWRANTYNITFDPSKGEVDVNLIQVVFDEMYPELPVPTRYGYEFLGWYTVDGDGGVMISMGDVVSYDTDMILYARWSARKIMISFDPNKGRVEYPVRGYEFDSPYGILPVPVRDGYTFLGWQKEDGTYITVDTVIDFVNDIGVVAQWRANDYDITLDANGGEFIVESVLTAHKVTYDSAYPQLATPTRYGYRFVGWMTENTSYAYSGDVVKIVSSQALVAKWAPLIHVVELDANGGSLDVESVKVGYEQAYGVLPIPVRQGYTFKGWANADGIIVTPSAKSPTVNDEKLTATWTEKVYNITFDPNGGALAEEVTLSVIYGQEYGKLPVPEKKGYKFTKWVDGNGNAIHSTSNVQVAEDTVYYAEWMPLVFDVEFDGNGSGMIVPPISVTYNSTYSVLPEIERNGYKFIGWFNADGEQVTEDSRVNIEESITLKAKWETVQYVIVFDSDNDDGSTQSMDFTFELLGTVPMPEKTGHIFIGWFDENGNQLTDEYELDEDEDNLFKAQWARTEYSIFFSVQDSVNLNLTKTVEFRQEIGVLPEVTLPGYRFLGWNDSQGNAVLVDYVYTALADTVLFAEFVPESYLVKFDTNGAEPEQYEMMLTNNEVFGQLPSPVKHGYVLIGWFTVDGVRISKDTVATLAEDTTLYARWAEVEPDTNGIFSDNSMLATSCEIIAVADLVLLVLTFTKRKKKADLEKSK